VPSSSSVPPGTSVGRLAEGWSPEKVRGTFRRLDPDDYPDVSGHSWNEIYGNGDNMAPGGLYLASRIAQSLNLKPGDRVLDLACGKGDSSIFLAKHFGVSVICFDAWTSATYLSRKIESAGLGDAVIPLDLDATQPLPFPDDYFQAFFCMQALHSFGTDPGIVRRLLAHLKPGGRFGFGGTCFGQEPDERLPEVFQETAGWDAEYRNYHSPPWWRALFEETRLVDILGCEELPDGLVMWEDDVLYHGEQAGWGNAWFEKSKWLIDQLVFSRDHEPYLTHYVGTVEKRDWSARTAGPRPSAKGFSARSGNG